MENLTITQQINESPQRAYYKLITNEELYNKFNARFAKQPIPKVATTKDINEATRQVLLEMFGA
jgi:hypothetical protein